MNTYLKLGLRLTVLAILAILVWPLIGDAHGAGGTVLAYSVITNADVNKIWRKAQGALAKGFNFVTPEFRTVQEFDELEVDASLREMSFPVDLHEDRGITTLPEGGREAEPMSVNAEEAFVTFVHFNGRFTVAKLARWASQADGGRGQIERQIRFQGLHKVRAMGRVIGDHYYGFSTGVLALVNDPGGSLTSGASHTLPLDSVYGSSLIPGNTTDAQKRFLTDKFKIGDRVALVRSGALVTNAIGVITAITEATPSITVNWLLGNVDPNDNDMVVLANGTNASTLEHTSWQRALVGLLDFVTSTSVHGISSATVPNWSPAYTDTVSGRFDGIKWQRGLDEIRNYGDEDAEVITLMAQGVYRDVVSQYSENVRFSDPMRLEIVGNAKAGGRTIRGTRRVPPGMVFMFDASRGAIKKKALLDQPDRAPGWSEGKELIDDSGWVFAIDWPVLLATQNRKLFAFFANQTEL